MYLIFGTKDVACKRNVLIKQFARKFPAEQFRRVFICIEIVIGKVMHIPEEYLIKLEWKCCGIRIIQVTFAKVGCNLF